jgi:hypothetical protein
VDTLTIERIVEEERKEDTMLGRIVTFLVVASLAVFAVGGVAVAGAGRPEAEVAIAREEDVEQIVVAEDDDGGDDGDSGNSGNSGDATNSRRTGVSRSDDRSRGDLTRDRTKDGPGGATRDRTANHTNDRSRHDTR